MRDGALARRSAADRPPLSRRRAHFARPGGVRGAAVRGRRSGQVARFAVRLAGGLRRTPGVRTAAGPARPRAAPTTTWPAAASSAPTRSTGVWSGRPASPTSSWTPDTSVTRSPARPSSVGWRTPRARPIVRLESVAEQVIPATTATGFADAYRSALADAAADAVGFKSIAAYRVGLDLDPRRPDPAEVAQAAGHWQSDPRRRRPAEDGRRGAHPVRLLDRRRSRAARAVPRGLRRR